MDGQAWISCSNEKYTKSIYFIYIYIHIHIKGFKETAYSSVNEHIKTLRKVKHVEWKLVKTKPQLMVGISQPSPEADLLSRGRSEIPCFFSKSKWVQLLCVASFCWGVDEVYEDYDLLQVCLRFWFVGQIGSCVAHIPVCFLVKSPFLVVTCVDKILISNTQIRQTHRCRRTDSGFKYGI